MKYILLVFVLSLFAISVSATMAWEPPEDCGPDQRQAPGNTNTPCKLVFPEIQNIEYKIMKVYPNCIEGIEIRIPGLKPTSTSAVQFNTLEEWWGSRKIWNDLPWQYKDNHLSVLGLQWGLNSSITESLFGNPNAREPNVYLSGIHKNSETNRVGIARPRTDNVATLVSACLALVQQEKDDIEHAARLAQEEADAEARRIAEADADRKEQGQALRDAETQARIAEEELKAVQERQRIVAETELIKTQTLRTQLEHEEAVAAIVQEIARIRLAGQQDRARLTNEYLIRAEASASEFNAEVEEIRKTIQDYLDFNSALLAQLDEYRSNIATELEEVEYELDQQRERIEELNAVKEEEPEEPTVTSTP